VVGPEPLLLLPVVVPLLLPLLLPAVPLLLPPAVPLLLLPLPAPQGPQTPCVLPCAMAHVEPGQQSALLLHAPHEATQALA